MKPGRVGITHRLSIEAGEAASPLSNPWFGRHGCSARLVLPRLTAVRLERCVAALEAAPPDVARLVVLRPDLSTLDTFAYLVGAIAQALDPQRDEIELSAAPRVGCAWTAGFTSDRLAEALAEAAAEVRSRRLRCVWGLDSPIEESAMRSLEHHRLVEGTDVVLGDLTGSTSTEGWENVLGRLRHRWGDDRVWLAAGLVAGFDGRAAEEIDAHRKVGALGAPRLYWQPCADLLRLWKRLGPQQTELTLGPDRAREGSISVSEPRARDRVLVTGGAGFIGSNLSARLLDQGCEVVVLDNLDRAGVERNVEWMRSRWGTGLRFVPGDIRDFGTVRRALEGVGRVFHLAGQVAVTSSLDDPILDFDVNARGTLNVLEAIRRAPKPPSVLFTSTNKVYGNLEHVALRELEGRYEPEDSELRARGIDETCRLDLHSPYGCSKGTGDQYMLDYAKSYGVAAVVFRMSCIYGPRQLGTEDQGWVAHFFRRALEHGTVTIFGDGKQVRDILFVDDLVDAFLLASHDIDRLAGRAFNIGGGPGNAISLLELLDSIGSIHEHRPRATFAPWRRGDQKYYVSDTTRFREATGWTPSVGIDAGLRRLQGWLHELSIVQKASSPGWSLTGQALAK
jgi:CDP-paratose 2-epimerase